MTGAAPEPCYRFETSSYDRSRPFTVELVLFLALVLSAVGLVAAILMQSRGSGLGATFGGGDASTFRTRRGVEQRLYQFTIILAVIFVSVAMIVFLASG